MARDQNEQREFRKYWMKPAGVLECRQMTAWKAGVLAMEPLVEHFVGTKCDA
jgi:hypothetical protein